VRPFFRGLFERDRTGRTWLSRLLEAAPYQDALSPALLNPGVLLAQLAKTRVYKDKILGQIKLERAFEYCVPASVDTQNRPVMDT
jgi:hypothetical protein